MRNVSDLRSSLLPNSDYLLSDRRDLRGTLRWLSTILGVCNSTLQIHGYFAGIGSSEVLAALNDWKIRLNNLLVSIEDLKILPPGLSTGTHEKLFSSVRMLVSNVRSDILKWIDVHPELTFALKQILPWTELGVTASTRETNDQINISLEEFDSSLFTVMDKIFVVMQKISSSLSTAPPSNDIPAWLVKTEQVISKACAELHMADIADDIRCVLARIRHVSEKDSNSLAVVGAAISVIMPIAEQYQSICTDILHRYSALHRETCKMSYLLAKSFNQIASEGFCAPPENTGEHGKSDKLENGTGLGDGEGAEDISKDVQDDEDLADLAQEKQQMDGDKEDKDTGVDAVNMDQEDLEADRSDFDDEMENEDGSCSDKEDEDDMDLDEETGSVDRLDASAVDEKMWDGTNDQDQKDTENEQGKGDAESEDKTAASANKNEKINESKNGDESENEGSEPPDDEGEAVGREDMDTTDPHAKEEPILDLPEDMELDGQDDKDKQDSDFDNDLGDLSDDNRSNWEGEPNAPEESNDHPDLDPQEQAENETEPANEVEEENLNGQEDVECHQEESETGTEEKERDELLESERTDNQADAEDIAPSEEVSVSQGVDQDQNQEHGDSGKATQEHGSKDQADEQNLQEGSADQGEDGKEATNVSGGRDDGKLDDSQTQAFKKLGDILEQWHRRQRQIQEASDHQDTSQNENQDANMEDADFEHLADDQDAADTQALGQATEEQAKSLDQSNAVESDVRPEEGEFLPDATEPKNPPAEQSLEDRMDLDQQPGLSENNTSRSYVASDRITENDPTHQDSQTSDSQEMEDMDAHLSSFHVGSETTPLTSPEEARRLWSHYESITNDLSLALTEQLRLILAPTLATKLRGDFRTGKRLNIKRVIPYIASQYKRDKIWMRRSVPSKRSYQIMLAVDDSKSMLESGSGQLAFETLALITKSLSMLEAGDLCVVSFGDEDHVRVAHEFGKTFSSEAGVQIFQQFSYKQTGTNVRKLISDSITLFREAKMKRSRSSGSGDLWQLELIISDGICEDHEAIRRLVRQAQEERIMIVFIIVDAVKGSSILDLTQASFEPDGSGAGEMKLKMKRYLEGFPFSYYLVVRDVQELPAILSLALKQWFAEVVDVAA
ncbi:midasin [Histoplasma capsulatum var. duboisii H88]|nr:midasin [Histoplasma capsulatum var. duboisii H88]